MCQQKNTCPGPGVAWVSVEHLCTHALQSSPIMIALLPHEPLFSWCLPSLYLKKQEIAMGNTRRLSFKTPNGAIRIPLVRSKVWRAARSAALQTVSLTGDLSTSCRPSEHVSARPCWFLCVWVVIVLGLNECIFLCVSFGSVVNLKLIQPFEGGVAPTCLTSLVQDEQLQDGWMDGWMQLLWVCF